VTEDPKESLGHDDEEPSEGSGATDDDGGAERAGLGKSEAEETLEK
jgi:hypothetical protein